MSRPDDTLVHPSHLTFKRELNLPPSDPRELQALPHQHRHLDSHSVFWDDLNQPKFLGLITAFYFGQRLAVYPATLIKTRQQAGMQFDQPIKQSSSRSPAQPMKGSIYNVARATVKAGGVRSLYQAFSWNIVGLPVDPIYIGTLEYSRQCMTRYLQANPVELSKPMTDLFITLAAGGAAAVVQQTFMVPIDVVTQRLMIQPTVARKSVSQPPNQPANLSINQPINQSINQFANQPVKPNMNAREVIADIIKNDGIRGLYKGYALTLGAVVPFSALQWALYWKTQSLFTVYLKSHPPAQKAERHTQPGSPAQDEYSSDWREMLTAPASAAVAATIASLTTQPFDTLKTRLQVQVKATSIKETFAALIKEKGWMGVMSGAGARVLTMMPSAVISMSFYEFCKRVSVQDQPTRLK